MTNIVARLKSSPFFYFKFAGYIKNVKALRDIC